jgi:hypothetical protein
VFEQVTSVKNFTNVVEYFETGKRVTLNQGAPPQEVVQLADGVRGFPKQIESLADQLAPDLARGETALGLRAALVEFVLDGLYANNRLNRKRTAGQAIYAS